MKKNSKSLILLNLISFLLGFQMSLALYINATFIKENSGSGNVSIFYLMAYAGSFLILINAHHLVRKYGKSKMFLAFLSFKMLALLGAGYFFDLPIGTIFAVWSLMSGPLMWVGLDIMIESFSQDSITGSIRGRNLSIMNAGVLLAPYLASVIIGVLGYRWVFLIAALLTYGVILLVIWKFPNVNHNIKRDPKISAVLAKIFRKKNIFRIYYISFMLEFFYAVMIVYMPIYLIEQGFDWQQVGKILTIMLLPFIFLQYPLGVLADKKMGEKELLGVGIVLMAVFSMFSSYFVGPVMLAWMVILFFSRVGAAMVEVLRDSYFYKQISPQDVDIINFFRTTRSVAYIVSSLVFACYSLFFQPRYIFLILGLVVLTALVPLWELKDSR